MAKKHGTRYEILRCIWCAGLLYGLSNGALASALSDTLDTIQKLGTGNIVHCEQAEMMNNEDPFDRFVNAFDCGDELFETNFNAIDGVGGNVGDGGRFTRVPRADQRQGDGWANHIPPASRGRTRKRVMFATPCRLPGRV